MSMKESALGVFRQPLNCAQAVAHAAAERGCGDGRLVAELAGCGGGRTPGGVCGALHAVHCLVKDGVLRQEATEVFAAMAGGAADCRSIRRAGVPCAESVGFAAGWLEKHAGSTGTKEAL